MVVRANKADDGIGGHISTFASAATLYEVGFNHFFRGTDDERRRRHDLSSRATPRPASTRARSSKAASTSQQLENFRRELKPGGGLSSYPHPWLMPDFWEFPTVSMGLGPIMAIYQARFMRYLEDRGLKPTSNAKVWAFLGDGETDEPESLGAITLPAREKLDNLIFVINCNLQRLDGPVRGNGQIIQELEATFRGAGWNVIKVLWGSEWDPLLAKDHDGLLVKRMGEVVDGEYQKYAVESGAYVRKHFWGADPRLLEMVKHLSDDQLKKLTLGGHDPVKVYAAYKAAVEHKGAPTVDPRAHDQRLRPRRSGRGQEHHPPAEEDERGGAAGVPHALRHSDLRRRSREDAVLSAGRRQLEDQVHARAPQGARRLSCRAARSRSEPLQGRAATSCSRNSSRAPTAARRRRRWCSCGCCRSCCATRRSASSSCRSSPTRRAPSAWRRCSAQVGIYSHVGQLYEPVDMDTLLYYKEAKDGQILEEGITEAGSMSSFIAAGTAYATHGVNTIPFFIFYSMFGFQRIGDLIWAAADSRTRGFMLGGTAGPDDARRRRAAAPGRPQPAARARRCRTASPTIRRSRTRSPSSSRTASGGCTSSRRASSTTSR